MQTLVLDLQENGGGYMKAAVDVANEFLQSRDLIVYTDGRERSEYRAKGNGRFRTGTLTCWWMNIQPRQQRLSLVPFRIRTVDSW